MEIQVLYVGEKEYVAIGGEKKELFTNKLVAEIRGQVSREDAEEGDACDELLGEGDAPMSWTQVYAGEMSENHLWEFIYGEMCETIDIIKEQLQVQSFWLNKSPAVEKECEHRKKCAEYMLGLNDDGVELETHRLLAELKAYVEENKEDTRGIIITKDNEVLETDALNEILLLSNDFDGVFVNKKLILGWLMRREVVKV